MTSNNFRNVSAGLGNIIEEVNREPSFTEKQKLYVLCEKAAVKETILVYPSKVTDIIRLEFPEEQTKQRKLQNGFNVSYTILKLIERQN